MCLFPVIFLSMEISSNRDRMSVVISVAKPVALYVPCIEVTLMLGTALQCSDLV